MMLWTNWTCSEVIYAYREINGLIITLLIQVRSKDQFIGLHFQIFWSMCGVLDKWSSEALLLDFGSIKLLFKLLKINMCCEWIDG